LRDLAETISTMWGAEAESDELRVPDAALIERVSRVRRRALEAIVAADTRFFDDVAVAVYDDRPPPKLDHLRTRRMRAAYRRPGADNGPMAHTIINGTIRSLGNRGLRASAGGIDLADLVDELELDAETRAAVEPRLVEYSELALTHALRRYEASMRFQAALEQLVARRLRDEPTGGSGSLDPDDAYISVRDVDGRAARDARRALTALNTETLAALRAELPPDTAERLRRAWNRARFPNIFGDRHSAIPMLTRALELPDLSEEQRERVTELVAEFRLGFNDLCEQLVTLREHEPASFDPRASRDDRRAQRQRFDRLRALSLERSELRDKTISRLRRLLDEAQNETLEQRTQAEEP
ncbi:MAG: hypothetical protein GY715_20140, partial [Planctomycetes bacterium]|nr:hypothetical protein [Planctomycetota bacterium]